MTPNEVTRIHCLPVWQARQAVAAARTPLERAEAEAWLAQASAAEERAWAERVRRARRRMEAITAAARACGKLPLDPKQAVDLVEAVADAE